MPHRPYSNDSNHPEPSPDRPADPRRAHEHACGAAEQPGATSEQLSNRQNVGDEALDTKRIGIYSGTFDPVHIGHVGFALQAVEVARLDEVVFVPEERPRGKEMAVELTHRVALLDRVVGQHDKLSVRTLSAQRFSVQGALPELLESFDGAELWLLLGSDVAKGLGQWPDLDELLASMSLVIGVRSSDSRVDLERALEALDVPTKPNYVLVDSLSPAESSTRIRRGEAAPNALPEVAEEYIQQYGLYGSERQRG